MVDRIGTCVFCQQTIMVKVPEDASGDEVNKEATMQCNCCDAREYQNMVTNINVAQKFIEKELIATEEIKEILKKAAELVGYGKLDTASLKLGRTTYTVKEKKNTVAVEKKTVETTGMIL